MLKCFCGACKKQNLPAGYNDTDKEGFPDEIDTYNNVRWPLAGFCFISQVNFRTSTHIKSKGSAMFRSSSVQDIKAAAQHADWERVKILFNNVKKEKIAKAERAICDGVIESLSEKSNADTDILLRALTMSPSDNIATLLQQHIAQIGAKIQRFGWFEMKLLVSMAKDAKQAMLETGKNFDELMKEVVQKDAPAKYGKHSQ